MQCGDNTGGCVVRMHPGRIKHFVEDVGHVSSRHFCVLVCRGVHKF